MKKDRLQTKESQCEASNIFMAKIENEISHIKNRLKDMPTLEGLALANEKLIDRIMAETDKRYACKRVENIVNLIGTLLVTTVFVALLSLIINA